MDSEDMGQKMIKMYKLLNEKDFFSAMNRDKNYMIVLGTFHSTNFMNIPCVYMASISRNRAKKTKIMIFLSSFLSYFAHQLKNVP